MRGCNMKKVISILILPLIAICCLFGCGDKKTAKDIKEYYDKMAVTYVDEGTNLFFHNELDALSISIHYPPEMLEAINAPNPSNAVQKRYRAIAYQQQILDYIFDYYTNNYEEFYKVADSKSIKDELQSLYDKLQELNAQLDKFHGAYRTFMKSIETSISDVMEYSITSYSYSLNELIEKSFDFMYEFHNVYTNHCLTGYYSNKDFIEKNIQASIDKAYLDIAYIVYLENFKAFNCSVGEHGVCDLSGIVDNESQYSLLSLLEDKRSFDKTITETITDSATVERIREFNYSRQIFEQRFNSYMRTYHSVEIFTISEYRFGLVSGVDYQDYVNSLTNSESATIRMLDYFVQDTFMNYANNINLITR